MSAVSWERWSRGFGMLFVVVVVVAFLIFGDQPKVDDSASSVASFYGDHHSRIAWASALFLFSFVFLAWFVGAMTNAMRGRGEGRLANVVLLAVAVFVAAQVLVGALSAGLAVSFANGVVTPDLARTLNTLAWCADTLAAYPLFGAILAATGGLTRAKLLPGWYTWFGGLAAVIVLLRGTTWASDGFWSPSGEYVYAGILAALSWTFVTSLLLYRVPVEADAPARAAAPTPA